MSCVGPQRYFDAHAGAPTLPADISATIPLNLGQRACPQPILPADACRVARTTAVGAVAREDPNG